MLVVLTELHRFGAGPNDFREQEIAVDPDTIHRLVSDNEIAEGQETTGQLVDAAVTATLTDGSTLTLKGSICWLVSIINEPYRMLSE